MPDAEDEILGRVAAYYTARLDEHGPSPAGVDWNGEASQRIRFRQLTSMIRPSEELSVLDFGCGYGALAGYLDEVHPGARYTGFDLAPAMIEAARDALGGRPDTALLTDADRLPRSDYVVASGVFNVKGPTAVEDWRSYVLDTLTRIDELATRGWAANFLTTYSEPEKMVDRLYYADPCELFDWAKRNASRHVALLHDYELWEFTLVVRHDVVDHSRHAATRERET